MCLPDIDHQTFVTVNGLQVFVPNRFLSAVGRRGDYPIAGAYEVGYERKLLNLDAQKREAAAHHRSSNVFSALRSQDTHKNSTIFDTRHGRLESFGAALKNVSVWIHNTALSVYSAPNGFTKVFPARPLAA